MKNDVVYLSVLLVVMLVVLVGVIRLFKGAKDSSFLGMTDTIFDVTMDSLNILSKDISMYGSKDDFVKDLSGYVADSVINILCLDETKISKAKLTEFIATLYNKYDDKLGITKTYNEAKEKSKTEVAIESDSETVEPVKVADKATSQTTNITDNINDFYK